MKSGRFLHAVIMTTLGRTLKAHSEKAQNTVDSQVDFVNTNIEDFLFFRKTQQFNVPNADHCV